MAGKKASKSRESPASTRLHRVLKAIEQSSNAAQSNTRFINVAGICRDANISRNSLYRYHPDAVSRIRALQVKYRNLRETYATERESELRKKVAALEDRLAKMTSLVDHYFSAYQEAKEATRRQDNVARLESRRRR